MALLHSLLFWPPVPTIFTVIAMANFLALISGGINEIRGFHAQYSKLMNADSGVRIDSKVGMNIVYLFAFIAGATYLFIFPNDLQNYSRFFLLRTAITLHFLKRLLEVKAWISMALLHSLLFWPPVPIVVTIIATANFMALINGGINEIRGKHAQYSKLMGANSSAKIGSKVGMNIVYLFAFIFGAASFFIFPINLHNYSRFFLLRTAITLHFLKRHLETLFVHKYSGQMTVETMVICSVTYLMLAFNMIYSQYKSCGLVEPAIDLKYVGLVLFVVGISGNLYHHYLLSTLREKGEKEYKIPKGGLFCVVICPHYLFEVIGFWGLAFIAQTLCALLITVGITVYLMGRSHATRKWYESKFDDFPTHVKAIIPYTF